MNFNRSYLYLLLPFLYAAIIFYLSSIPKMPQFVSEQDKVIHFIAYALFSALIAYALYKAKFYSYWVLMLVAWFLASVYGISDEYHQRLVPGRSFEIADMYADSLGALLGSVLFLLYFRMRCSYDALKISK